MALKRIELDLYIWEGLEANQPSVPQYQINKSRIDTHTNITIEIGELVRDYLEVSFNDDYASETRWVRAVVRYYDENDRKIGYITCSEKELDRFLSEKEFMGKKVSRTDSNKI